MASNYTYKGIEVGGNLTANNIKVVMEHQSRGPPPKNIRFKVEKPIKTFTGREAFLQELHHIVRRGQQHLKDGQIAALTQAPLSVVAGTGGIGKTETVRMYIQHYDHEYDHIIWIDAAETSFVKSQFEQLAIKLEISTNFDGQPKEFELILQQIFEKLLEGAQVVLLVIDNADAFEEDWEHNVNGIRGLLPRSLSPFFIEPTVIVTSRNQKWNLHNLIRLDWWTEEEVTLFVIGRLGLEKTSENKALAIQLGNLFSRIPIALQSAIAVILHQRKRKTEYGIQNLIDEYKNGNRQVLSQKPLDSNMKNNEPRMTMSLLWNISLEKIVLFTDGEFAIKILCFIAYMSPTCIPQDFLFSLFQNYFSKDKFKNALEILEDYSLITFLSLEQGDSDTRSISIHRMIQDATIENLRTNINKSQRPHTIFNENTYLNETEVLLKLAAESLNYTKALKVANILRNQEFLENLVHITNHVSKKLDLKEFRELTEVTAKILQDQNNFTKSIELYERLIKATSSSKCNVNHDILEKIRLTNSLTRVYRNGGYAEKSIALLFEVLENATRALGPHHTRSLGIKGEIANALRHQGKYYEAMIKFKEVLKDFKKTNKDTQSRSFLVTKNNYACLLVENGESEEGYQLITEVLMEYEKSPNWNFEDTIATKTNMAKRLQHQGKFNEASAIMLQNIVDATRHYGPTNLPTLKCKAYYASLIAQDGKNDKAASLFLELLEILETQLGSDHHETLVVKHSLGQVYMETKEYGKALPLLNLEAVQKVFGTNHPKTTSTAQTLGFVMEGQGRFKEAVEIFKKVLEIYKQVLGSNHPHTLDTMLRMVSLYCKMDEFDKASKVGRDLLSRHEEVLGKYHPKTIKTMEFLKKWKQIYKIRKLTAVNVQVGRSLLQASDWNMEAALNKFRNLSHNKRIADSDGDGLSEMEI